MLPLQYASGLSYLVPVGIPKLRLSMGHTLVLKRVDEQALFEHERDSRIPEELVYTNRDWV